MSAPSRHAHIQEGDHVWFTDAWNTCHRGVAASSVMNDGEWPQVLVRFHRGSGIPTALVPARDVDPVKVTRVRDTTRTCWACGNPRRIDDSDCWACGSPAEYTAEHTA